MAAKSSSEETTLTRSIVEDRSSARTSGLDRIRQRKAHSRSRKGCLVCRQRHKRCDENFVDGSCDRCRRSGFQCVQRPGEERLKYVNLLAGKASDSETPSAGPSTETASTTAIPYSPPRDVTVSSTDLSEFISSLFQPFDTNQGSDRNNLENGPPPRVSVTGQDWLSGALADDMDLYAACLIGQLRFAATSKEGEKHLPVEEPPSTTSYGSSILDIVEGCTWLPKESELADPHSFRNPPYGLGGVREDNSLNVNPSQFSLADALASVCDLQVYNFTVAGCAASYGPLLIGESIVKAVFGPQPIIIDLNGAYTDQAGLVTFAQADIGHCICTKQRRPLFTLMPYDSNKVTNSEMFLGVPSRAHHFLSDICMLSVEDHVDPSKLAELEQSLKASFDDPLIPVIWSRAAMITLYQRLHNVGPLHPTIRAMSWDILLDLPPQPCRKSEIFPLFLAGAAAILETQRAAVRQRWVKAPEKGFEEGLSFLEDLWAHVDKTGHTVSWLDYLEEKGGALAFF
ncbi:hypothetical protein CNBJ0450 [Cryptococcus deneoformans B-3501A]|uniref:hypothetical protein n=1 Tax=Cryptococcus deneoformans (strain B-3501A) TaxID=283643 RepID=UPI000042F456|nr:hypothetical protein CNBJ0450 [Cryptococcus neoformans var. neoformans B-3501A]EAL18620.1 hypothetical protein CNBJ0450 [Cryptococcus neoformans var. neoformans B-3501A]